MKEWRDEIAVIIAGILKPANVYPATLPGERTRIAERGAHQRNV
jgi:hypothetical protein